ncbi:MULTISPECIES: EAL domain-containing protein [unclassified Ectothiorhodospira]|uniref:EAL domain-containing protein n=1 Tax=unclassified Ectothiorhodospira TaxID=2684909 RepID=UPI001EE7C795|nr:MULTISPECIES: EAL domain-containing protein [unclassified Ectothiorhodospira]MCG5516582.1 EAL domain-containing protein [Ectothiorhodospira sp. 9100]MCG5519827.1 EAL domain-containing protein [Ectothiorhodospira sp. 9905]
MSRNESPKKIDEAIRARAEEALRAGDFDLSQDLFDKGHIDLAEVTEHLRIYQAELEVQNAELREAQLVAEHSMGRYSAFFSGIPVSALVVDRTGLILESNQQAAHLFGLHHTHLRHHFLRRLVHHDNERDLNQALIQAGEQGKAFCENLTFVRTEGDTFHGELHVARLPSREGEGHEFVCAVVDLTERLRHEAELQHTHQQLRDSEARYRILADYSPVWDYWFGPEGQYRYISPACLTISGHPPGAFMDDPDLFARLIEPEDRPRWEQHEAAVREQDDPMPHHSMEFCLRHADGEIRWIEHECQPVIAKDGSYQGRRGVNRDITDRKRAELEVAQVSLLYATLSAVNQAIVRIEDEQLLLDNLARIAVEYGGFTACAISLRQGETQPKTRACKGLTPEQIRTMPLHEAWELVNQQPYVYANREDPEAPPHWQQWARANWIQTFGHYPLIRNHRLVGVASFFSDTQSGFTPQIDRLVQDITEDFSYALQHLELEKKRRATEAALSESEARYRSLFENTHSIMLLVDPEDGCIVDANPGACQFYGWTREQMRARRIGDINILSNEETHAEIARVRRGGHKHFRFVHRLAHGELRQVEVYSGRIQVEGRELVHSVVHDITERNRAEERLRLADRVFQAADEGIMVTDMDGRIVAVNPAFTRISGYTEKEALGQTPALLHSGRQDIGFYQRLWHNLLELGHWRGEIWNRRKNGEIYPEWLTISAVRNDDGEVIHYVGVFSDIGQIKEAQQQLEFMAHYDPLTGLANRALLRDRLKHALRRAQRNNVTLTLLFVDLDRFKTINDTLGHNLGDLLLQTVAQRMKDNVRASDTLSRLGGDEFVLLLEEEANAREISSLCRKLLSVLETPMLLEGHELVVTASIGVATYPDDGLDADSLLKNADLAMYEAKTQGRNAYEFFAPSLSEGVMDRLKMESALRGAAARNELRVHYQPQVRLRDGSLLGVEALVRWEHPTLGLVSPGHFIPLAEEMGVIGEISAWVLREACRQMRAWQDEGREVGCMAVNLSVQQLERDMLVGMVRDCLEEFDLPAGRLELEVTESLIMRAPEKAQLVLQKLKVMGVKISVDDFGTGYSSLSYLKRLPLDRLKIDRSFIQDIGLDANGEAIIRAIIGLGRSLGLETLAEGVEQQDQVRFLLKEGCDLAQGFLFSRPVPPDQLVFHWDCPPITSDAPSSR